MENNDDYAYEHCVYALLTQDQINDAIANDGCGSFTVNDTLTAALGHFQKVREYEGIYLLLIANSASTKGIESIAKIDAVDLLSDGGTQITFSAFHHVLEPQAISILVSDSSGEQLIGTSATSYALCITPDFAHADTTRLLESDDENDDDDSDPRETIDAFKTALIAIESKITDGQRKMLVGHYKAPEMTLSVTKLAELADYKGAAPGKLHYGKLARNLAEAMDETPPTGDQISMLGKWTPEKDERGHGQWVMYDELATAIEELGWVE